MRVNRLFIITAVLLVIGVGALSSGWHGDAGVNFGSPLNVNVVRVSGHAMGGRALVGLLGLILGAILLVITLIAAIVQEFSGPRAAR